MKEKEKWTMISMWILAQFGFYGFIGFAAFICIVFFAMCAQGYNPFPALF